MTVLKKFRGRNEQKRFSTKKSKTQFFSFFFLFIAIQTKQIALTGDVIRLPLNTDPILARACVKDERFQKK